MYTHPADSAVGGDSVPDVQAHPSAVLPHLRAAPDRRRAALVLRAQLPRGAAPPPRRRRRVGVPGDVPARRLQGTMLEWRLHWNLVIQC